MTEDKTIDRLIFAQQMKLILIRFVISSQLAGLLIFALYLILDRIFPGNPKVPLFAAVLYALSVFMTYRKQKVSRKKLSEDFEKHLENPDDTSFAEHILKTRDGDKL